jgi:uncharacterized membrane protein YkgB
MKKLAKTLGITLVVVGIMIIMVGVSEDNLSAAIGGSTFMVIGVLPFIINKDN